MSLPIKAMKIITGPVELRNEVYRKLLRVNHYDVSRDWFQPIYEAELSEGKRKGQHFTPVEVYSLVSQLTGPSAGSVHEPTAGTGGLIIGDWWCKCSSVNPWSWKPKEHPYVAWELSDRAVPLLLLNLSVRGIHALVYHGDTLEKTVFAKYYIDNISNDPLAFSEVREVKPEKL